MKKHHIVPKCVGGLNNKENLTLLTYREHIIAHRLLIRIYPKEKGLVYALYKLINPNSELNRDNSGLKMFSSRDLEKLRIESSEFLRNINLGKTESEETKQKIRISRLGKKLSFETKRLLSNIRTGHEVTKETRNKISKSNINKTFSNTHKSNLSKANKGKTLSEKRKTLLKGKIPIQPNRY